MNPLSSIALGSTMPRFPHRFIALALVPLLAGLSEQSATAQAWQQNPQDPPQYQPSQYVQPSPNYVPSAAPPSPYGYPQPTGPQPQYAQPQYAQPQQYAQPGPYGQQPQYAPPSEPQYPVSGQPDAGLADPQQLGQQGAPPSPQGFAAEQLQQLVAPIALYPDNLVAEILAASTYPAQVIAADNWLHAQGYQSPDQIAYGADAQTNWDPSVKALTAFPLVLDLMNHDLEWTTDLGNAYYNQPQDVLQTIQVMRQRAEQAGTLASTPQQEVSYDQGYIQVVPVNPQLVYVPSYNPWSAYGQPVSPYPGFSLVGALQSLAGSGFVRFGLGVALSAFSHTPFGWAGWALNWLASSIFFHQSPYTSHSTSVAHWGNGAGYYGGQRAFGNRTANGYGRQQAYDRSAIARGPENYAYGRGDNRAFGSNYARPAVRSYAYGRPQVESAPSVRAQTYGRSGGYGNGFYGGSQPGYGARAYATPQQAYRGPAQNYQRNDYAQRSLAERSYAEPRSYSGKGGYAEAYSKQERSEGSHFFGGHGQSHESFKAPKAPRAPKAPKMSGGHHGGGRSRH